MSLSEEQLPQFVEAFVTICTSGQKYAIFDGLCLRVYGREQSFSISRRCTEPKVIIPEPFGSDPPGIWSIPVEFSMYQVSRTQTSMSKALSLGLSKSFLELKPTYMYYMKELCLEWMKHIFFSSELYKTIVLDSDIEMTLEPEDRLKLHFSYVDKTRQMQKPYQYFGLCYRQLLECVIRRVSPVHIFMLSSELCQSFVNKLLQDYFPTLLLLETLGYPDTIARIIFQYWHSTPIFNDVVQDFSLIPMRPYKELKHNDGGNPFPQYTYF